MWKRSFDRRIVLWCGLVLAGCAGTGSGGSSMGDIIDRYKTAAAAQQQATAAARMPPELEGVFKKFPITNGNRPETWPRAAITITAATPAVFSLVGLGDHASMTNSDCVSYSVRLWKSATEGQTFDGLKLCVAELYPRVQGVPMYQVPTWGRRTFFVGENNTGSVRTQGPTPPNTHFPDDPALERLWLDRTRNSAFFVGGILTMLGYNWNDVTDKRVWFVSVPAKA